MSFPRLLQASGILSLVQGFQLILLASSRKLQAGLHYSSRKKLAQAINYYHRVFFCFFRFSSFWVGMFLGENVEAHTIPIPSLSDGKRI